MRAYDFQALADPRPVALHDGQAARLQAEAEWEQARSEGFAAGRDEALAALAPASAALAAAATALHEAVDTEARRLEAEAVELALQIAEKVVAGTLDADPGRVVDIVRGALRGIVDRSRVTVLVHPDDLDLVRDAAAEVSVTLGGVDGLEVQAERRVGAGGAIVRHQEGEVDATVASKLQRVRELVRAR